MLPIFVEFETSTPPKAPLEEARSYSYKVVRLRKSLKGRY